MSRFATSTATEGGVGGGGEVGEGGREGGGEEEEEGGDSTGGADGDHQTTGSGRDREKEEASPYTFFNYSEVYIPYANLAKCA